MADSVSYAGYGRWKAWDVSGFGQFRRNEAVYFEGELRRAGVVGLQGAQVLELGFGNGSFAGWARAQGADYQGVEVIPELLAAAGARGFHVMPAQELDAGAVPANSLDLVAAFDVFEHLPIATLQLLLQRLAVTLKPGGRVLARMPSGDSPFSRGIQHGDLTHCTVLGSSAVRQLAPRVGLSVEQVRAPFQAWQGDGALRTLKRAAVAGLRALAYPVIAEVFMGGGRPVLTPNMLIVLRKSER